MRLFLFSHYITPTTRKFCAQFLNTEVTVIELELMSRRNKLFASVIVSNNTTCSISIRGMPNMFVTSLFLLIRSFQGHQCRGRSSRWFQGSSKLGDCNGVKQRYIDGLQCQPHALTSKGRPSLRRLKHLVGNIKKPYPQGRCRSKQSIR